MRPNFGIFEPVFESAHGYLALLHLPGNEAVIAVAQVRDLCLNESAREEDISRLLSEINWRPHLVAAVATIVSGYNARTVRSLWQRIDLGSWVTPQLAVALFLVDPDFEAQSRHRLELRCPIDSIDLVAMLPPERHSAAGPAGLRSRSGKAAATLLELLNRLQPAPDWVSEIWASEETQALLQEDFDGSANITSSWLNRIREITSLVRS